MKKNNFFNTVHISIFENAYFSDLFMPVIHTTTTEDAQNFHQTCTELKMQPRVETFENAKVDSKNRGF